MRANNFFAELYRRNPLLALVGWLHIVALLATMVGYFADERTVLGVNTWIRPMQLTASIAVYVWTIAWFTRYIRRPRPAMKIVSVVIALSMVVESTCILLQGARATPSYLHFATDFDAAVFQTMGVMIGVNLLMVVVVLFLFSRPTLRLPPVYLWGIRAGIVLFLVGGAIGGMMIVRGGHTAGAPDGGPGLPLLNGSTVGGDLRIAHGLALHALQILPLIGYLLSRWRSLRGSAVRLALLAMVVVGYAALVYALFRQAMEGSPFT